MTQGSRSADGAELASWRGRSVQDLRRGWGVPALHVLATTPSTNDAARRLAEAGADHGTTVIADHQTAGRGRHGRSWTDEPGASLLLSMVLRPDTPAPRTADGTALPLLAGLACARAIHATSGLDVGLEWPNDLVLDDRKLGGILCEAALPAGTLAFVIVGVGINVARLPDTLPADVRASATSLADAVPGSAPDLQALAGEVARRLAALRADAGLDDESLGEIRRRDTLLDRIVRLGTGPEGVARGILPDGALAVDVDGRRRAVRAGSVTPVAPRPVRPPEDS